MAEIKEAIEIALGNFGDELNLKILDDYLAGTMIDNILREETYNGIVRDVMRDEEGVYVRVTIFDDERHDRIEEVFPVDIFRDGMPKIGNSVQYHALQYVNKDYGGYFSKGISKKRPLSDFDPKEVQKVKDYFNLS